MNLRIQLYTCNSSIEVKPQNNIISQSLSTKSEHSYISFTEGELKDTALIILFIEDEPEDTAISHL